VAIIISLVSLAAAAYLYFRWRRKALSTQVKADEVLEDSRAKDDLKNVKEHTHDEALDEFVGHFGHVDDGGEG
jgi:hypothetical protein